MCRLQGLGSSIQLTKSIYSAATNTFGACDQAGPAIQLTGVTVSGDISIPLVYPYPAPNTGLGVRRANSWSVSTTSTTSTITAPGATGSLVTSGAKAKIGTVIANNGLSFSGAGNQLFASGNGGSWALFTFDGNANTDCPVTGWTTPVTQTFQYLLTSVTDTHNNVVTYTYAAEEQWTYPDSITYNGNTIKFYREARSDVTSAATGIAMSAIGGRLKTIEVKVGASRAAAYKLVYASSTATAQSLLSSVTQYGTNAVIDATGTVTAGTALPAATMAYGGGSVGFSGSFTNTSWSNANGGSAASYYSTIEFPDFDGDGKADVCGRSSTGIICLPSTGSGFGAAINGPAWSDANGWTNSIFYSTIKFPDINGDGKADVCARASTGIICHPSTGSGFGAQINGPAWSDANGWTNPSFYSTIQYVDIDGDGKADVCARGSIGIICHPSTGSGFGAQITTAAWSDANGGSVVEYYSTIRFPDINGDGKADVCGRISAGIVCYPSTGSGFGTQINGPPWNAANGWSLAVYYKTITYPDFNGDGKADFCARAAIGIICSSSTGSGYNSEVGFQLSGPAWSDANGWTNPIYYSTIQYTDIDGDGKADVCARASTGIICHALSDLSAQGTTAAFSDANLGNSLQYYSTIRFPDFNGDGKADMCGRSAGGIYCEGRALDGVENLRAFSNGLGSTTTIAYTPSSAWPIQSPCPAGSNCSPPVQQTVSSMTVTDGRGGSSVTTYSYSGGLFDPVDRRFLGFRYAKAILPCNSGESAPCPYEETTFKQDYGSVSKPDRADQLTGAGVLLTSTINEYTTNGATKPYTSLLTGEWKHVYSGGTVCPGANCKRTYSTMGYNAYGEVTSSASYGDYAVTGDESNATTTFVPNTTAYIVGLPALQRTYSGLTQTTKLAETQLVYDQPGAATPNWNVAPVKGDQTQNLRWLNTNSSYVSSKATYDTYGNVLTAKDELNNTTTTVYDSTYHLFPTSITNALGQVTSQTWNYVCGVPLVTTGPNGATDLTTNTYDALCRPTRVDTPLGGFTITSYLNLGNATTQYVQTETPAADGGANLWSRAHFDGLGRTWKNTAKGTGSQVITQTTSYNNRGKMSSQTEPYYSGTPNSTSTTYDALDRPLVITNLNNTTRSHSYGLWTETVTDELGHPKTSTVNAFGKVVNESFVISGVTKNTSYSYDLLGNQTGIIDAEGNDWIRAYDSLGRLTSDNDPDRGTWTYAYFADGKLQSQTDAKAQTTTFAYDALRRKTSETVGAVAKTWTYDQARSGFFNVGHLTSMAQGTLTGTYDHDLAGRQVKYVKTIDTVPYTFTSGFDAGGRLKWTTYPDADTVGTAAAPRTYDGAGRPLAVPGVVTSATYKAWGAPAVLTLANGVVTTYSYDSNHQLSSLVSMKGTTTLQNLVYTRNAAGNITSFTSPTSGEGWSYTYDDIDRLLNSTNTSNAADNQNFTYSPAGNVLTNSRLAGSYTYPAQGASAVRPHAVTNAGGVAYTYDANGNMTAKGATAYTWDAANRLTAVGGTTFTYDADDDRVKKFSGGVTSVYPRPDYRVKASVVTKDISLGELQVAERTAGVNTWLHLDHLGSTQLLTNASGVETQRLRHRPYGERFNAGTAVEEEHDFIGERRDAETGLIYQQPRYYDPVLARYTKADDSDADEPGVGPNRYAYAENDPVNAIDDGNHTKSPVGRSGGGPRLNRRNSGGFPRPTTISRMGRFLQRIETSNVFIRQTQIALEIFELAPYVVPVGTPFAYGRLAGSYASIAKGLGYEFFAPVAKYGVGEFARNMFQVFRSGVLLKPFINVTPRFGLGTFSKFEWVAHLTGRAATGHALNQARGWGGNRRASGWGGNRRTSGGGGWATQGSLGFNGGRGWGGGSNGSSFGSGWGTMGSFGFGNWDERARGGFDRSDRGGGGRHGSRGSNSSRGGTGSGLGSSKSGNRNH